MNNRHHVLIVGGGVFGGCCAYELAKAGLSVTVVERDPIGAHASGRNPGNLNPILATPPVLRPFAMASFSLHHALQAELMELDCEDYQMAEVTRVLVSFDARDHENLIPVSDSLQGQPGFSARWVEAPILRLTEPRLSPNVESGLLITGNRSLNAFAFQQAVLEGAQKHGACVIRATATHARPTAPGYTVETDRGDLDCETLVLANGSWGGWGSNWLGIALPVVPVKGQILRMRLPGGPVAYDLTHDDISLYRRGDGELWVGVTHEPNGCDEQPTQEALNLLVAGASRILPAIANAEVVGHLAAFRPMAPAGLPLIGAVTGHDNLYVANGGGTKGMLLSAGVGKAIRDLIVDGSTSLPVDQFRVSQA